MKPKVTVLGWYNKRNIGDESYKLAFPQIFPDYEFKFVDALTASTAAESEAFILGGGDILAPSMLSQLDAIDKPRHVISATASNPGVSAETLGKFEKIMVRDYPSIELLNEKGLAASWLPDVAMVLRGDSTRGDKLIKEMFGRYDGDLYDKVVTVVVNSYLLQEDHPECHTRKFVDFLNFAHELAWVADHTPASFLFIPFGARLPFDDRVTESFVSARCKFWKKNLTWYDELGVQDTLDILAASDAVVSTRLHSSILACANGVPFVDITWNHKNRWFLDTIGMQHLSLPYKGFDPKYCEEVLEDMIFRGDALRKTLTAVAKKQTNIIRQTTRFPLNGTGTSKKGK
jgi:polysaccharide pyruvyl transferase WcaK-like protein